MTMDKRPTLTQIAATTGMVTALINMVVIIAGLDLTVEQLATINAFVLSIGGMLHAWRNPSLPGGPHEEPPAAPAEEPPAGE